MEKMHIITHQSYADIEYLYDEYDRLFHKNIYAEGMDLEYAYVYDSDATNTSNRVSLHVCYIGDSSIAYDYSYDDNGNIVKVGNSSTGQETKYYYNDAGQLIREDIPEYYETYVYTYDKSGNRLTKSIYNYTYEDVITSEPNVVLTYDYTNTNWGDQLTSYNGTNITYDGIGNPLSYNGYTLTWEGRLLVGASNSNTTITFTYNDEGIRTSKTVNGVTTNYYLNGTQIIGEETNGNITIYVYDESGAPIGMQYHGATYLKDAWDIYWFEKNLQGDTVRLYNETGELYISYWYDAWGYNYESLECAEVWGSTALNNPFRYRGYYYDKDLDLYYLNSRYYDWEVGRFISPDDVSYLGANADLTSYNLYAYCSNNPVMYVDPTGHFITAVLVGALIGACFAFSATVYVDYSDDGDVFNGSVTATEYVANVFVGGGIGASCGWFLPNVGAFLSTNFTFSMPVLATGATMSITVSGAQIALGTSLAASVAFFAKDPYIKHLEKGMSQNQKEHFQREIEALKHGEGRGGNNNLARDLLRDIAEWIRNAFK